MGVPKMKPKLIATTEIINDPDVATSEIPRIDQSKKIENSENVAQTDYSSTAVTVPPKRIILAAIGGIASLSCLLFLFYKFKTGTLNRNCINQKKFTKLKCPYPKSSNAEEEAEKSEVNN